MTIAATHLEKFTHDITGDVIVPGDDAYEAASTIFIAKGTPAVIVRPRTADDVAKAIAFAREASLVISVRNGGHSNAGHSTNKGGLVIDLSHMNSVEILDQARGLVRIGGGALWGDVAQTLGAHGLAISSGDTGGVGVSGLTLAGGIGWMVRKYGLTLDNLLAVDIVTADGETLHTSQDEHSDLFWAIRGGGGNFGVATSFEFTAQAVGQVYAGAVTYELKDLDAILKGWREAMRSAPEELTTMLVVMPANPAFAGMPSAVMLMVCYASDDETAATKAVEPLLQLGRIVNKDLKLQAYAEVLQEAHPPKGVQVITNNAFIREFNDELIDVIANTIGQILQIRSVGGAMNRVAADATAFAHRDSEVLIVSPTFIPPGASPEDTAKALEPWDKIAAFSSGAYINFFSRSTPKELAAAYPAATYERLRLLKQQYDPQNVFSQNYNIAL